MVPERAGCGPCHDAGMGSVLAITSAIGLLAAVAVGVYAIVLRLRGRTVPPAVLRVGMGLLGAGLGAGFIFAIDDDPFSLVLFLGLPAFVTYALIRRGHRVAAGILLATLGLPGALWWGFFLVQDLVDPIDLYEPVLWLWWATGAALVIGGALVARLGDRAVPPTELIPHTPAHVRDPVALATAFHRELAVGSIQIQTLVSVGVASLLIIIGLPLALQAGLPWPIAVVGGTILYAVVGVELWQLAMPRRVRGAWEGYALLGNPEMKRWRATTATAVPRTVPAMQKWLERNPDRPETRWARASLLVAVGDLVRARTVAESMPLNSDWDRFEQHLLLAYIDWVAGGDPDLVALRQEAETVGQPGSPERFRARGEATLAVARDLAVRGADWMAPLTALRDEAGPAVASRVFREEAMRNLYPQLLPFGAVFCVVIVVAGWAMA